MKDPTQVAQKWSRNLGASTDSIRSGVQAVTVAPGQAAAAKRALWLANLQAAADKWARNTAAVSVDQWKQDMLGKGVDRIAAGATAAEGKMAQFMGQLLPFQDRLKSSLPARGTMEQNIARMNAFVRGMAQFKRTGGAA